MGDVYDEFIDRIERRLRRIEDEIRRSFEDLFKSFREEMAFHRRPSVYGEYLEPLYTVKDLGDRIVIYIDLPYAAEGSIDVKFEGRRMYVYAKLREKLKLDEWSRRHRGLEVTEYRAAIDLPIEPRPEKTSVRTRKGVVEITIYK